MNKQTNKQVLLQNNSVTGPTRREACKLLLLGMVKNTGKVNNLQTGILRARQMSTPVNGVVFDQYPEGLTRGVIHVQGRRSGTRQQGNTKRLD